MGVYSIPAVALKLMTALGTYFLFHASSLPQSDILRYLCRFQTLLLPKAAPTNKQGLLGRDYTAREEIPRADPQMERAIFGPSKAIRGPEGSAPCENVTTKSIVTM
jgi:hypothetical protein